MKKSGEHFHTIKKEILHEIIDSFLKENGIDSAESVMRVTTEILDALHNIEDKIKKKNYLENINKKDII
mgnify:FL=1|jgi:hypothetical protein